MEQKLRLWPAYVIVALGAAWVGWAWLISEGIRQDRVMRTIAAGVVTLFALLLWLALLSRLPWRRRLSALGGVALVIALGATTLRIRGVTGDFLPVLDWRWSRTEPPPLPAAAPPLPEQADAVPGAAPPPTAARAAATPAPAAPAPAAPAAAPAAPPTAAPAPAWPQFQGPTRNAVLPGPRLARDFDARPARLLWRQPIGVAWSSFAVADGLAVTQEQRGEDESVVAYDFDSGRPVWSHADRTRYDTVIAGVGPRATPTIADGRVFTMGATGILNALDLRSGRRLWSRQVADENQGRVPEWGKSCSPLVSDGRVIVSAGGAGGRSLVAYDAATGEPAWSAGDDGSSYSSPMLFTLHGEEQVVMLNRASVAGHDPATGRLLWEHPWPKQQPNVTTPLLLPGGRLLVSSGYGIGSKLLALGQGADGAWSARFLWESPRLKSKFANLVEHGGFVYGLDDGVFTCLDPKSGERCWKGGRYGHGQVLLVGGLLLVQTEEGEIVLVEPSPEAHRELTRFQALDGKTWNPPVLVGARLLVRNDREAALYELPLAE